ncbi:MAG TPA: amylo-alpha-1,6-glucosidase [Azospirillaceae bacterium]|nr:amylo-alpha-1,6-glucosidase [Azospirillaceae bacterium]
MQDGSNPTAPPPGPDIVGTAIPAFPVPSTASLEERRPRTLKDDDAFAVLDHAGDILSGPGSPEGIFFEDTRHLSHLDLSLGGRRPMLLSSDLRDDNAGLTCDLTNADIFDGERLVLERDLLHVRRTKFLWRGIGYERIVVRSFAPGAVRVKLELRFAADFADLFEVRGSRRPRRGTLHPPEVTDTSVTFAYTGLDDRRRSTLLLFEPRPAELTGDRASYWLDLEPGGRTMVWLETACIDRPIQAAPGMAFLAGMRGVRRGLMAARKRSASVDTSNELFNEAFRRARADLSMLMTGKPGGPYPYAGIPWFCAAFGRDALITAHLMLWVDPEVARGVLNFLAENQAVEENDAADAEPGKILHEARGGEMAVLGEVPFRRYYGSVDSTPLFVWLAGAYLDRTGDVATIRHLWPNIEAALAWIDIYGDRDGDGFVEYGRKTEKGLANQGWKDSHDSIFHADGSSAPGPIALCEVQAYVYGAWRAAAAIARSLGFQTRASELERKADVLRTDFAERFWCPEIGTFALALDGAKRPCRVRSSNAGHALLTGIALPEHAAAVAAQLTGTASFSGWGVRTLAAGEARYNPMSYHNGSVWPHDNALIALGLARYGHKAEVLRIFEGLFAASLHMDLRRLPELFCGFSWRRGQGPVPYPVACSPQAWAAAVPLAMLQAALGLEIGGGRLRLRFTRPALPDFMDEVTLSDLAVGHGRVDVRLRRHGASVSVEVLRRDPAIRVVTVT